MEFYRAHCKEEQNTRAQVQMFTEHILPWCLGGHKGGKNLTLA
jgi:TorA maturation chaperone TorD